MDENVGRIGFAFPGSNPSYELETSTTPKSEAINITSINIKDSSGMTFSNIQFTTTDIPSLSDKFILSIDIPKDISTGTATVTLTLASGKQLNAILEIIDPLLVSVKTIRNQKKRDIRRLQIDKVSIHKQGTMISITLEGNNFVNRQIFFDKDGADGREVFVKNGYDGNLVRRVKFANGQFTGEI